MRRIEAPVHVEVVGGHEVRYYTSPIFRDTGRPDMPWHSCDDIWRAIGIGTILREDFLRRLRAAWADPRTAATMSGPVVIAPFHMGNAIVEAWAEDAAGPSAFSDLEARRIRGSFRRGNTAALKAMTPHLDPVSKMLFALEAMDGMSEPTPADGRGSVEWSPRG